MSQPGHIVLFRFPRTDLQGGKLRPALLLGKLPGDYGDWLICMISSQMRHYIPGFDEILQVDDPDYVASGLKLPSLIRVGRLAVVEETILVGSVGHIDSHRLERIKGRLARWLIDA
jgi:mRNA interferase MazF